MADRLQRWSFVLSKLVSSVFVGLFFRLRAYGITNLPKQGGALLLSNHQSFLDPVLVGMALPEPISYLARRSLFRIPGFRELLKSLGTHPVRQGAVDISALKAIMRLLRDGGALLMFPEGTRSYDGSLGRFKPGAAAVALRCGVPVLPVCVEGTYVCWPRTDRLPRPARVAVAYGRVVEPDGLSAEALTARLRERIQGLQQFLREYLGSAA